MARITAVALFLAASLGLLAGGPVPSSAQEKKAKQKKAATKVEPPDEATLKQIAEKTAELRKAVESLRPKAKDELVVDVEVFLKAAEWIVRHGEWLTNDAGKQTSRTLDIGLERAKQLAEGKTPWRDVNGRWVARGYRSSVDGSAQPFAMLRPVSEKPRAEYRMDVVLHGRDATLTEVKFLSSHEGKAAPKGHDYVLVEVYGRGNNAYRWAGETDVFEAMGTTRSTDGLLIDEKRIVLRGFSMGGAGTWHIGLHHPGRFAVIGPGAGFTTTHGYVANLPKDLPPHAEKCLRIYDAVNYAENAFNVPVVAYSGENDAQKKAADNIENALKNFKEPVKFTHFVAPGLEHTQPAEWQAKLETEYRKYADKGRPDPDRIRFVTYTPRYGWCDWISVRELETIYERAVVDATRSGAEHNVATTNVRALSVHGPTTGYRVKIDGQDVVIPASREIHTLEKREGKWTAHATSSSETLRKWGRVCGPIDDAFTSSFAVEGPVTEGWHPQTSASTDALMDQFAKTWDRHFRGQLPTTKNRRYEPRLPTNLVLFGDPRSNHQIAKLLPRLPITWTKDELVVNGVKYDPKTHLPVLIYPNPLDTRAYVVLNSGHTFKEADLKGTNALLYPRLGDWAVIKPTPTERDPAAFEVVAAGLFDEFWKFPEK